MRTRHVALWVALLSPVLGPSAQTAPDSARSSAQRGLVVRVAGGLSSLSLGEAAAFHQSAADAYVAVGVPVPTQRSFAPGLSGGIDVLWSTAAPSASTASRFGVGARFMETSAYSLYGDYAGTLDLVSTVSVLFVESVSLVEFAPHRRVRPFLGSRGGMVYAASQTDDIVDLGEIGRAHSSVRGRGTGFSVEGLGGGIVSAGPVDLWVQAGYRYARIRALDGEVVVGGETVEEGRLPYGLTLSGWSADAGVSVRLPL